MEKRVRIFKSFAEAEQADRTFYASLTNQERMEMFHTLLETAPDFLVASEHVLTELNADSTPYLATGGYAVSCYGTPRFSDTLEIFVPTLSNRIKVLLNSAFPAVPPVQSSNEGHEFRINVAMLFGLHPCTIRFVTSLAGVDFHDAWPKRTIVQLGDVAVAILDRESFIANRRAIQTLQARCDLNDLRVDLPHD